MTPEIAFGRPVIRGTRISARMLAERFAAGDSVSTLADDYTGHSPFFEADFLQPVDESEKIAFKK